MYLPSSITVYSFSFKFQELVHTLLHLNLITKLQVSCSYSSGKVKLMLLRFLPAFDFLGKKLCFSNCNRFYLLNCGKWRDRDRSIFFSIWAVEHYCTTKRNEAVRCSQLYIEYFECNSHKQNKLNKRIVL